MATDATLPFSEWDIKEASKQLSETVDPLVKTNRLFIEGDHWQNRDGYIGPRPKETDQGFDDVMVMLESGFVSRNVIKEICRRHKNGVVGLEPRWGLVPREQEAGGEEKPEGDAPEDEAQGGTASDPVKEWEGSFTEWWNDRNVHKVMKDAAEMSLWGRRGTIRIYIPAGLLGTGSKPSASSLRAALRYIYVEALEADVAGMVTDPNTNVKAGVLITTDADNKEIGELVFPEQPDVDPDAPPNTIIKPLGEGAGPEFPMEIGGRLTMFSIERPLLITKQIQQSQKALNLDLTIMPRNIIHGGFLERLILAGQMPGHWEVDEHGVKTKFVPEPFETGAGTINFVSGQEVEDAATGRTTVTTPQVHYQPPTDVQFAITAKNSHYQDMLEETDQPHVLITGAATPSGKSREEARADFEGSLRETQTPTEDAGRWLLETVTAIAEWILGSPGKWLSAFRADFECIVDSGPPDTEYMAKTIELKKENIVSEETAMMRVGVRDVAAERARRNREAGGNLSLRKLQMEILGLAKDVPDIGFDGLCEFLGLKPGDITMLKKGAIDPVKRAADLAAATAPPQAPVAGAPKAGAANDNGRPKPGGAKPQSSRGAQQRARPVRPR